MAPFEFEYREKANLLGVDLMRYEIPMQQFSTLRNDAALLDIVKNGVVNVTVPKAFPLFLSMPHFDDFEGDFLKYGGMPAGSLDDVSFMEVEPVTGKTLRISVKMQILSSTADMDFSYFHPNVFKVCVSPRGLFSSRKQQANFLPIYTKVIYVEAQEAQTHAIVSSIYPARCISRAKCANVVDFRALIKLGLYLGIPFGILMVLVGLLCFFVAHRLKSRLRLKQLLHGDSRTKVDPNSHYSSIEE